MSKRSIVVLCGVAAVVAFALSGCSPSGEEPSAPKTNVPAAAGHSHEGHEHASHTMHSEYEGELAKLSPKDRQLAEKQKVCPVSGEPLGSMGKPYKVTVEGRDVFLCCQGCEDAIKKDPAKYLAKLPE